MSLRALPAGVAGRGRAPESPLLSLLLALGFSLGMAWSFLPSGLEFDAALRDAASESGGSGTFALQWMPLIALGLAGIAYHFRFATLLLRDINPWTLLLPLWALASLFWAPDPFKVVKQTVGIAGVSILAIAFVLQGWHPDRFVTVLRPLVTGALVLSLLVGIFIPEIGVHSERQFELNGSWRGITYQKNGLGQLAAVGIILWFHAWAARSEAAPKAVAGLLLSLLLVLLSRSSTALLLSLIACGVILLKLRPPLRVGPARGQVKAIGWLMVLVPAFMYFIFIGSVDGEVIAQSFGEVFGKDATFSGRTIIWGELLREIEQHSLIGVGYNSFWHTPLAASIIQRLGWPCPSGHNGYLDIWNTLGIVGLGLLIAMLLRQFADIAKLKQIDRDRAALHFALLLFAVLANLTESGWFLPMAYTHIVVIYSSVCVSRLLFDARLRAASAPRADTFHPAARPNPP